jgi:two-component system, response regulator YesN
MSTRKLFRLVIADDEPLIRNGLARNVPWRLLGFELLEPCEDGSQVLELTRRTPVDAVILDIRMPGLSGIELARTIRQEAPGTCVLFLTAHSDFQYAQAAIEHQVWRYLVKPVKYAQLLETLEELYRELLRVRGEPPDSPGPEESADPVVRAVDDYLESHYHHASLVEVSGFLGLSPEYVSRLYHQRAGRRFAEQLQKVRMETAARLLITSRYRVCEISEIVGYSSAKNFTRRFHRHWGMTPREYRINALDSGSRSAGVGR